MGKKLSRRLKDSSYVLLGTYRSIPNVSGLDLHQMAVPLEEFSPARARIVLNWDFLPDWRSLSGEPFERAPHLQFAKDYLANSNFDYKKTDYYQAIAKGRLARRCRGREKAAQASHEFTALIDSLRGEGYRPEKYGPISFVKCLDGSVMVLNGKHRLAALIALGVKSFPVVFCFDTEIRAKAQARREAAWPPVFYRRSLAAVERIGTRSETHQQDIADLVSSLRANPLTDRGEVYHQIPFHEFRDLRTQIHYSETYRRLAMILSHYSDFRGKRVLDLGSNVGFYSFSLAKRGAAATGVELRRECYEVARKVAAFYNMPATFLNKPLTADFFKDSGTRYDITLCFSMLQWVIAQAGLDEGKKILRAISENSSALFFDISVNTGKACLICPPGQELSFVRDLLRENTSYSHIQHVGDVHPHLTDTRHVFHCSHQEINPATPR